MHYIQVLCQVLAYKLIRLFVACAKWTKWREQCTAEWRVQYSHSLMTNAACNDNQVKILVAHQ
jgi:hypothetical protein